MKWKEMRSLHMHRVWLFLGILLVPFSYYVFTILSVARIRCHVPSFSDGNFMYEITAYFFIIFSGFLVFRFGVLALRATDHLLDNVLALMLAAIFNVFSFALVFYIYGVIDSAGVYLIAPSVESGMQSEALIIDGREHFINLNVFTDSAGSNLPFSAFSEMRELLTTPWSYVIYSLSNTIPGAQAYDFKPCPSASFFVLVQNVFGLVLTGFFGLLGARVSKVFQLNG